MGRAAVRSAQGKVPEALADVAEAVTRDPQNTQAYVLRARLHDMAGDLNAAIADYSTALNLAPSGEALLGRATAYLRASQFALATNDCESARRINPNAALAHLCLAEVHIRQNAIADAVSALNSAMLAAQSTGQQLPVLPQLPAILAQATVPAPTPAPVATPVPAPAPVAPPAPVVLPQTVVLASLQPKPVAPKPEPPKPAAKAPAAAKKINVADYNRQARDLTNQGRYEDALDLLNQALDQSPKYAQAFNARGFVHLLMLNYTQAVADFSEAIRLKPDYANAFHNRAVALRKLSKTTDADADEKNASRFMAVVYPVQ